MKLKYANAIAITLRLVLAVFCAALLLGLQFSCQR